MVTQMENPPQNRIYIFLSCLNLNMNVNKNTDFFLPPGTTDTTEANLAGVLLTVNQKKKHGFEKTQTLPKLIFMDALYVEV